MYKKKQGRSLSRPKSQRKALLTGLAASLFIKGKITTTGAKAKELQRMAEKMITRAKPAGLPAIRLLRKFLPPPVVKKLIVEIGPKYKERPGGYTRIIKLGQRKSDGSRMAAVELV
ncbi:MAG: 50S ribosomal protein L17 [Patescibacteria group bacterium]|nr:50S ribosomal protein L17 [Patescibacteria group bacterium]